MGRVKASKLTGKFYLRKDRKPDTNGKLPIYLEYVMGTKHARTETGVWVEETYWDEANKAVSRKHPQSARLNNQLEQKRRSIDEQIYEFTQKNSRLTIDNLRAIVQGRPNGKSAKTDFVNYAIETIEQEYKLGKVGVSVRDNAYCPLHKFRQFLMDYPKNSI